MTMRDSVSDKITAWWMFATEASYQRHTGDANDLVEREENFVLLVLLFVVIPLLGFALVIVFIYRRVANNRTTYCGSGDHALLQHCRTIAFF